MDIQNHAEQYGENLRIVQMREICAGKHRRIDEEENFMRTQQELRMQLRQIDHKGYKAYKVLEGEYDFRTYRLCIDHVQGDPFATPSRVRIVYYNRGCVPQEYLEKKHRRIAVEDACLLYTSDAADE